MAGNKEFKLSRRNFIRSSVLTGAAYVSGLTLFPNTGCSLTDRCIGPSKKSTYVLADIHNHLMFNDWNARTPPAVRSPAINTLARTFFNKTTTNLKTAHAAGVDLICVGHYNVFDELVGMPTDPNPAAPQNALRMMDLLEEEITGTSSNYAKMIRTPEEFKNHFDHPLEKDNPKFRIAILHSLEGGHALGGDLGSLKKFSQRGVVLITIGHFFNKGIASAPNALHFFPDDNSTIPQTGLSEFGKEVILEMEDLGMIVDVTHLTPSALHDVLSVSTKPLIATHISVKTLGDHAISIHDEHIQEIVRRGGMIGIIFDPYWLSNYTNRLQAEETGSLGEMVRTIRYVTKISNSMKNICIGSDFGGYIAQLPDMNSLCQIEKLRILLHQEFGSQEIIENILAKNVINFIRTNWKQNV